jgi:hypothetical protein
MAITTSGTTITFNDASTQTTAYPGVAGGGYSGLQVFNSPGTFATPANTTKIYAIAVGAGGGGGQGGGSSDTYYCPNGGDGLVAAGVYSVTASVPIAITIGTGGNAPPYRGPGYNISAPGNAGNATSVGNLLTSNGGGGGGGCGTGNANPGPGGTPGTAPLATVTANTRTVSTVMFSNDAGYGGPGNPSNGPGGNGTAGRVLIYF